MTRLEAVNEMLTSVGEDTVLTAGTADTSNAEAVLDAETRAVLARGYTFNTDDKIVLPRDASSRVAVPLDALFIDSVSPETTADLVPRGGYLWDREKNTDVLDADPTVKIIRAVPFDGCPYHVQRLIVGFATVRYQASYVGSAALGSAAEKQLGRVVADNADAEADSEDYNMLSAPDVIQVVFRRKYYGAF